MTSAPSSPSSPAQNGAEMRVPTSMTRSPSSGPTDGRGHGRGRPSTRSPTIVRWISLVPAQIDEAW